MFKKYYKSILFFLGTSLTTSLYAAHLEQEEGKNDTQETSTAPQPIVGYYNYTLKHSKKKIDNTIGLEDLKEEKQKLSDDYLVEKLKYKKGAIFFTVIISNKNTGEFSKLLFINRSPNIEINAIKKAQSLFRCHTITHTQLNLSAHILFQLLGWLEQEKLKYIPKFIYSNSPICVTCDAIVSNFFKLNILSNAKGCYGSNSIDLENICPLAQQYIKRELTLPLAKKLLLPTLRLEYEHKLKLLEYSNQDQKKQTAEVLLESEDLQKKLNNLQNSHNKLKAENDNLKNKYNDLENKLKDNIKQLQKKDDKQYQLYQKYQQKKQQLKRQYKKSIKEAEEKKKKDPAWIKAFETLNHTTAQRNKAEVELYKEQKEFWKVWNKKNKTDDELQKALKKRKKAREEYKKAKDEFNKIDQKAGAAYQEEINKLNQEYIEKNSRLDKQYLKDINQLNNEVHDID